MKWLVRAIFMTDLKENREKKNVLDHCCPPLMIITGCFIYISPPLCQVVARLSCSESNRETITREIISSVLSGYAPCPVTSPLLSCPSSPLASFNFLCAPLLFFFPLCSPPQCLAERGRERKKISNRVFSLLGV